MPIGDANVEQLQPAIAELRQAMAAAGKPPPEIVFATRLTLDDPVRATDEVQRCAAIGISRLVHGWRYADATEFARAAETMRRLI